ncbi:MAG: glutamate 5-kinase [Nitrososphaeria archaeon]
MLRPVVIKVGTSVLELNGGLNVEALRRIAREISESMLGQGIRTVLVTSGAILTGLDALGIRKKPSELTLREKQMTAAVGQPLLMKEYIEAFGKHGIKVAQILVTEEDFTIRTSFMNFIRTTKALLSQGILPIINENDAVSVRELVNVFNVSSMVRFGDNDRLSAIISSSIRASRLIILTDVDGILDVENRLIKETDCVTLEKLTKRLSGRSAYGRGGIRSKIEAACFAASRGIPVNIINGKVEGNLRAALRGENAGTLIRPMKAALTTKTF